MAETRSPRQTTPVRFSESAALSVTMAPSAGMRRTRRSVSTASGSAYCSPVKPATNRPPRISPPASRRRNSRTRSRHGTVIGLACKQRLEHHAVAAQQGARHRLDSVLTDIPRIGRTPRHARPSAGFGNGTQTAGGSAGERPQSREPVRVYPSLRDQLAQGGGRIQPAGAGLRENVVEERRSAGFEVREDASGAGGERRGRDIFTLGNDDLARHLARA